MAGEYSRSRFYPRDSYTLLRGRMAFNGTAGKGATGTDITIVTPTGQVTIDSMFCFISETCESDSSLGTISLGLIGDVGYFIGNTAADGSLAADSWWYSTSPEIDGRDILLQNVSLIRPLSLAVGISIRPLTQNITNGQLDFFIWWRPLSPDGNLALGANMEAL